MTDQIKPASDEEVAAWGLLQHPLRPMRIIKSLKARIERDRASLMYHEARAEKARVEAAEKDQRIAELVRAGEIMSRRIEELETT